MKTGIVAYGAAIPRLRIRIEEIDAVWHNSELPTLKNGFLLSERAVLSPDEDTMTLAVAAAKQALGRARGDRSEIGALYLGTFTNPYDSRPSCSTVREALGLPQDILASDLQFSGKSGTSAMIVAAGLTEAGFVKQALVVAADTVNRHVAPGDLCEYSASAGGAAFVLGREQVLAEILAFASNAREFTDFFRLEGDRYIRAGMALGRDVFEMGLVTDSVRAAKQAMQKAGLKAGDFRYGVFPQQYGNNPAMVAEELGFTPDQIKLGNIATAVGDCGSAGPLLGLGRVFDQARAEEKILLVTYGFGAGADALCLTTTRRVEEQRPKSGTVQQLLDDKQMVDYATAIKMEFKYLRPESSLGPSL